MNAYRLILTHFSQRYPSVPSIPLEGKDYVLLAFDFMRIHFQDLLWAPAIMPALVEAFPPSGNENENDENEENENENEENENDNSNIKKRKNDSKKNLDSKKIKVSCRCHEFSKVDNDDDNVLNAAIKVCSQCTLSSIDKKSSKKININKNAKRNIEIDV